MTFALWLCYLVGNFASMWKRASFGAKSQYTPWANIKEYAIAHGSHLLICFLLSTTFFWTVWKDTSFLTTMMLWFGIHKDVEVPLNPFTAAMYGVVSDWGMDFLVAKVSGLIGKLFGGGAPDPNAP